MNNKDKFFFFRWYNIVEKLIIDLKIKGEKIRVFSIFGEKWVKLNFNKKKRSKIYFLMVREISRS